MIRDTSAQDVILKPIPVRLSARGFLWALLGVVGVMLAALLITRFRGSSRSVNSQRLRIAEVSRGTLVRDAAVTGRVVAAVSPSLYAPSAGTVALKIRAGDTVKKDELVALLDSPELTNQLKREVSNLEQLELDVSRQRILAQKKRLAASRDVDQAEIELATALRVQQRYDHGYKGGVVNELDFLRAQDALHSAEVRSKHAEQSSKLELQDVELEIKSKLSQLERQRLTVADVQRRVDALRVLSPIDGVIGTVSIAERAVVPINSALMTLVSLTDLELELEVPETFADDLGLGMSAEITVGSSAAPGKVSALSPEVVNHKVLARVRFSGQQPGGLRQNQRVTARILIEEKPNVILLPRGPFLDEEGGHFAYVVSEGVAVKRPLQIGATSTTAVEIVSGLQLGEKVVIAGGDTFEKAARVSINN